METEMAVYTSYEKFRDDLKQELEKQVEGFVRIGYKLKLARDTQILKGSGYRDYHEFAWEEHRLDRSVTSRYISINDRYSVGGNSEELKPEYQGYGYTKLAEMLSIPDAIAEKLDPSMSKTEIRQIAGEIKEEHRITDLEVMMEEQQEEPGELTFIQQVLYQYFRDQRESFRELAPILGGLEYAAGDPEKIMDIMAPAGTAVIFVRLKGIGKIMMHLKGTEQDIQLQNTRTMETVASGWTEFCGEMKGIFSGRDLTDPEKAWEDIYQEPFGEKPEKAEKKPKAKVVVPPKKEKIAPAQKESEKPAREEKQPEPEAPLPAEPQQKEEDPEKIQIPGQDTILNYPECLPGDWPTKARVDGETVPAAVEKTPEERRKDCMLLTEEIGKELKWGSYRAALELAKELMEHLEVMAR